MAWGLWNKIKKGFQKVGKAIKKGVGWVNDKIIKPIKPVLKTAANVFLPGVGGKIVGYCQNASKSRIFCQNASKSRIFCQNASKSRTFFLKSTFSRDVDEVRRCPYRYIILTYSSYHIYQYISD